ncbi:hypothetical protein ACQ86N_47965 [Puia sp. P3]|uniref:hypothetical protein n=1 Tax=Puia sp. P3 TaxID=3423952 RepID=UPI003D66D927
MKQLISLLALGLAAASCHKTASDPDAHVLAFLTDSRIRVNQAATIYDLTALKDSIDLVNPPTGVVYIWQVSPDNGAAVWRGNYRYGLANVAFRRSGTYRVKAEIYDTIAGRMLAHTNTAIVRWERTRSISSIAFMPMTRWLSGRRSSPPVSTEARRLWVCSWPARLPASTNIPTLISS